jgi:hypothetical protein
VLGIISITSMFFQRLIESVNEEKRLSCTVNGTFESCTKASPEVTLIIVFNDFSFMKSDVK